MPVKRWRTAASALLVILSLIWQQAGAQDRQDREGITLYWGLVPAAIAADQHALEDLHGGPRKDGGQAHHLVIALFDTATGHRIGDAIVRAQLSESGIVDEAPKYMPQMAVNGLMSYGQWFTTVGKTGPYRFRISVQLANRAKPIEFDVSAGTPHGTSR